MAGNDPDNALSLQQVWAERLAELRRAEPAWDAQDLRRREDLARAMTELGFRWTLDTVVNIEGGKRRLQPEEMLTLCYLFRVPASAFLEGEGFVALSDEFHATRRALRVKQGSGEDLEEGEWRRHPRHPVWSAWKLAERVDEIHARSGPAEQKAARRVGELVGVPADTDDLAHLSLRCWGRTLSEERDARVAERAGPDASPRSLQALRGHVTRELVNELVEEYRTWIARWRAEQGEGEDDGR